MSTSEFVTQDDSDKLSSDSVGGDNFRLTGNTSGSFGNSSGDSHVFGYVCSHHVEYASENCYGSIIESLVYGFF